VLVIDLSSSDLIDKRTNKQFQHTTTDTATSKHYLRQRRGLGDRVCPFVCWLDNSASCKRSIIWNFVMGLVIATGELIGFCGNPEHFGFWLTFQNSPLGIVCSTTQQVMNGYWLEVRPPLIMMSFYWGWTNQSNFGCDLVVEQSVVFARWEHHS